MLKQGVVAIDKSHESSDTCQHLWNDNDSTLTVVACKLSSTFKLIIWFWFWVSCIPFKL